MYLWSPVAILFTSLVDLGDGRASEQPALTVIHTVFMREHNRLVQGLRDVNPHWSEEKLFDHARRIVIAQTQHITFNEFLPRILSWNAMNLYGLKLLPHGYYKEYNPSCNPAIFTEFAAAAFRIGHSLLRPHIPRLSPDYQIVNPPILLRDGFFKVDMIMQVMISCVFIYWLIVVVTYNCYCHVEKHMINLVVFLVWNGRRNI